MSGVAQLKFLRSGMADIDDNRPQFAVGDLVLVTGVPQGVESMPDDSRRLFTRIVGRVYRVDEVSEWGDLVLNVQTDDSQSPDWNACTLWLPPAFVELASHDTLHPIHKTRHDL